jgi:hypothetical protein
MSDLQEFTGIGPAEPAEVELYGAALPAKADEKAGIAERAVHESWKKGRLQIGILSVFSLEISRFLSYRQRSRSLWHRGPLKSL